MIPVIDIFAGPGGLGEGFCSLTNVHGDRVFKIALSIEKDEFAHQTLTLRSFFRQFRPRKAPKEYYDFLKGKMNLDQLYNTYPKEAAHARKEAWMAKLGDTKAGFTNQIVDEKIKEALKGEKNWLLIGGPPCQAYSIVGRSRRQEKILDEKKDERVGLYKQYLRVLAAHNPAVFVMENVKGLLSAETRENAVFTKILQDLSNPAKAFYEDFGQNGNHIKCPGYKIYSLSVRADRFDDRRNPVYNQKDFIIKAEEYGIPQTRHRIILLGLRNDIDITPGVLRKKEPVGISQVLADLPRLRSGLSKQKDENESWRGAIRKISTKTYLRGVDAVVKEKILSQLSRIRIPTNGKGGLFVATEQSNIAYRQDWFTDKNIGGVCNHESRGHMDSDLLRYFFVSCFGNVMHRSPKLEDFPEALLPNHENVNQGIAERKFADRFRVQLANKPAKTITSHISKDGHYYIHYDPLQCRSFTVREAARIQTFPDNYYFCGPRTAQFSQVGNAVPPLLANKIAEIVFPIFEKLAVIEQSENRIGKPLTPVLI
ncbi:MAG: DNA cytosine methyltransferase [Chitinophagaceae bacterium]|nr:DNA cytosine methyltransferase [Chitinophagaceae bacterium]